MNFKKNKSLFLKNTFWGLFSNILQNLFFTLFFIIIARHYDKNIFGSYVVANMFYSFILGVSSLGLGNWYVREYLTTNDTFTLTKKFFKIQILISFFFIIINVFFVFIFYDLFLIRVLSVILALNLFFDNIIYVIKYNCIAMDIQYKFYHISTLESFFKFCFGLLILITPFSLYYLLTILIFVRLFTIKSFLFYSTDGLIGFKNIFFTPINLKEIFNFLYQNSTFLIISIVSLANWRIGNFFISKFLTLQDVSYYEVSFKVLSISFLLPLVLCTSIYPILVKIINYSVFNLKSFYNFFFNIFILYGLLVFLFINAFADKIIPLLFGQSFTIMAPYCIEIFYIILIFPTLLLQANLLIAIKLEKIDLYCNIVSILFNIILCIVGFHYFNTLSVVIISIFFSFFIFHLIQDFILFKKGIIDLNHILRFYFFLFSIITFFYFNKSTLSKIFLFFFVFIISIFFLFFYYKRIKVYTKKLFNS